MTNTEKICLLTGVKAPNINDETGIHYGVIPSHVLNDFALEDIYSGTDLGWEDWKLAVQGAVKDLQGIVRAQREEGKCFEDMGLEEKEACVRALKERAEGFDVYLEDRCFWTILEETREDDPQDVEEMVVQEAAESLDHQETTFRYEQDGYVVELHPDNDVWVLKSPYYTLCSECSPCAPNAGYLTSPGSLRTYCLGPDWFDEVSAEGEGERPVPYDIWSVGTGERVFTKKGREGD